MADAEHRALERELHGVQQHLGRLAIGLGSLRDDVEDDTSLTARLAELERVLDGALRELREVARACYPSAIGAGGVGALTRSLAAGLPLAVEVVDDLDERPVPGTELTAWFVICEALENAVRHASATRAGVRLRHRAGTLEVTVSDDGRGGARMAPGTGLDRLRVRAEVRGGTLDVHSAPGGTRVTARLPWD